MSSQWINVKERLPENGECVAVTNGADVAIAEIYPIGSDQWEPCGVTAADDYGLTLTFIPTHWMSLPELPSEAGGQA